jgi:hypothetical protein
MILEDPIDHPASLAYLRAMCLTASVNVVKRKEFVLGLAATRAVSAVVLEHPLAPPPVPGVLIPHGMLAILVAPLRHPGRTASTTLRTAPETILWLWAFAFAAKMPHLQDFYSSQTA